MNIQYSEKEIIEGPIETVMNGGFFTVKINNQERLARAHKSRYSAGQWVFVAFGANEIGEIIGPAHTKTPDKETRRVSIV